MTKHPANVGRMHSANLVAQYSARICPACKLATRPQRTYRPAEVNPQDGKQDNDASANGAAQQKLTGLLSRIKRLEGHWRADHAVYCRKQDGQLHKAATQ